jgi:hypothetical protein
MCQPPLPFPPLFFSKSTEVYASVGHVIGYRWVLPLVNPYEEPVATDKILFAGLRHLSFPRNPRMYWKFEGP